MESKPNIIFLNPSEITPYAKNPRRNAMAVDAVAQSITTFGFRAPIIVDRESVIICGHTRWLAAQKLGLESVPVIVAGDLSETQVKGYRIADNRTGELAEWDFGLLKTEILNLECPGLPDMGITADWHRVSIRSMSLPCAARRSRSAPS